MKNGRLIDRAIMYLQSGYQAPVDLIYNLVAQGIDYSALEEKYLNYE